MERTFHSEAELRGFAADFARRLRPGDVVGLSGPLGAGKTVFIRAVVSALHGHDPTASPTFIFWHRYQPQSVQAPTGDPDDLKGAPAQAPARPGPPANSVPAIDHLDLYRVDDPRDLVELGLDEVFDGSTIVLVEWWKNAPALLPRRHYEIEITGKGDEPRHVSVTSRA